MQLPRISLFWRSFLLIAALLVACLALAFALIRSLDPTPPEQNLAWELASAVNLTRTALITAQPEKRRSLLADLERDEGVRVVPLEETDKIQAFLPIPRKQRIEDAVKKVLGPDTLMATQVNSQAGLWVSFPIEGDRYWLVLPAQRLDRQRELPVLPVLLAVIAFALLGTTLMSRVVNRPLAQLSEGLKQMASGQQAPALREDLASEIASVNRNFNHMVHELSQLENDRSIALAGISHDIRTPLTRLRMEIEMAGLSEEQRQAMASDIERINEIVGQFMEYARAGKSTQVESVRASQLVQELVESLKSTNLEIQAEVQPDLTWEGNGIDLQRILTNLLENARRYGKTKHLDRAQVKLSFKLHPAPARAQPQLVLTVQDQGIGVPPEDLPNLTRPFTRLDKARGSHEGAGLGLAIVERIAQRHGGSLLLTSPAGAGLYAEIRLPQGKES